MDSLFYFGDGDEPLFGALHLPANGARCSAGVVLCPPLGFENLASYRPLRALAERLASVLGRPTLRFDWPATGDSVGDARDPLLVQRSLSALERAVEELRQLTGVAEVALVGVGIGATLATVAAARNVPAEELVLWAPPLSGRAYIRELRALHSLSRDGCAPTDPSRASLPEGSFEATGAFFSAETARDLGELDLMKVDLTGSRVRRALVIGRDEESPSERLVARLDAAGVAATAATGGGADELVSNVTKLPENVFERIVDWLGPGEPQPTTTRGAGTAVRAEPVDGVTETIVALDGPDGRLVGVETTPSASGPDVSSTWIVFPTTGVLRRAGPNRLWTSIARDLAKRGHPSLRVDVHGAGDSAGPETAATNLSTEYSEEVLESVRAALAHLREARGAERFVLVGLCSGAFSSFRTAVVDSDVVGAMLINLATLFWTRDVTLRTQTAYLRESLFRRDRWREVVHGRVNVFRVSAVLGRTLGTAATRRAKRLRHSRDASPLDSVGEAIEQSLAQLEERSVPLLFAYAGDDPGIGYLERHLGRGIEALLARRNVRVEIVPGAGHTFTPLWSQDVLRDLLDEHLAACGVSVAPAPAPSS
jgi:pimeloyl-ACP methyl ester carboxylesterase